ncbi:hypothetical protein G7Y89_g2797 [Cudoniella acicularis]|uniref:C2H2-type domain-containing protein n=1 Tax=Cudoniella acicularis TaxID=354080 RepID=A0A8H4W915_9HELO|nr:hypothetical protein G7Y89_g2797 [Cudoniella acicularis]
MPEQINLCTPECSDSEELSAPQRLSAIDLESLESPDRPRQIASRESQIPSTAHHEQGHPRPIAPRDLQRLSTSTVYQGADSLHSILLRYFQRRSDVHQLAHLQPAAPKDPQRPSALQQGTAHIQSFTLREPQRLSTLQHEPAQVVWSTVPRESVSAGWVAAQTEAINYAYSGNRNPPPAPYQQDNRGMIAAGDRIIYTRLPVARPTFQLGYNVVHDPSYAHWIQAPAPRAAAPPLLYSRQTGAPIVSSAPVAQDDEPAPLATGLDAVATTPSVQRRHEDDMSLNGNNGLYRQNGQLGMDLPMGGDRQPHQVAQRQGTPREAQLLGDFNRQESKHDIVGGGSSESRNTFELTDNLKPSAPKASASRNSPFAAVVPTPSRDSNNGTTLLKTSREGTSSRSPAPDISDRAPPTQQFSELGLKMVARVEIPSANSTPKKRGRPFKTSQSPSPTKTHKKLGRPFKTPKAVAKAAAKAAGDFTSVSKKRRRPFKTPEDEFVEQEPKYIVFKCEWVGCPAELHNLETLKKHLCIVHGRGLKLGKIFCRWGKCGRVEVQHENRDGDGVNAIKGTEFETKALWWEHVDKDHLVPIAWYMGDGPFAKGPSLGKSACKSPTLGSASNAFQDGEKKRAPQPWLFDKEGRQVTPSVENQEIEYGDAGAFNKKRYKANIDKIYPPKRRASPRSNSQSAVDLKNKKPGVYVVIESHTPQAERKKLAEKFRDDDDTLSEGGNEDDGSSGTEDDIEA